CGSPDVQEDRTSVSNISRTQDRKVASPPCEISDVCKRLDFTEKHFPLSGQEYGFSPGRNMASPPCAISDVMKDWTSLKNISRTQNKNTASPLCETSYVCLDAT
ncbi:unnamed protein product, partial [Staurois parvus]